MVSKKSERFANQLHLAMYGETLEERVKRESIIEKTIIARNLLQLKKITIKQIADAINESIDFVEKIKLRIEKH